MSSSRYWHEVTDMRSANANANIERIDSKHLEYCVAILPPSVGLALALFLLQARFEFYSFFSRKNKWTTEKKKKTYCNAPLIFGVPGECLFCLCQEHALALTFFISPFLLLAFLDGCYGRWDSRHVQEGASVSHRPVGHTPDCSDVPGRGCVCALWSGCLCGQETPKRDDSMKEIKQRERERSTEWLLCTERQFKMHYTTLKKHSKAYLILIE